MVWQLLYNLIFIPLGWIGFRLYGLVNRKARVGIRGRAGLFDRLARDVERLAPGARRIWFHSSSMGEFEQAKPIIAEIKRVTGLDSVMMGLFLPEDNLHAPNESFNLDVMKKGTETVRRMLLGLASR